MKAEVTVDHLAYLTQRAHRRATHANLRRVPADGVIHEMRVMHEADDCCCRAEPWVVTWTRILEALDDDGYPALGVLVRGK